MDTCAFIELAAPPLLHRYNRWCIFSCFRSDKDGTLWEEETWIDHCSANIIVTQAVSTAAVSSSTATGSDPKLAAIRATAEAYLSANSERFATYFYQA